MILIPKRVPVFQFIDQSAPRGGMSILRFFYKTSSKTVDLSAFGTKHSRMDQVKFVKTAFRKLQGVWSASSRPYLFKLFKGCLLQILLDLFLNTLSHLVDNFIGRHTEKFC